ncbi:hypothetical protein SH661x_003424 [Planctomicrobium sp. SH661]|uniref:hypothetical protein n=1 Tax=Planctomicrobium sp. SH661 TaxID=3448124 RepID=UPI003F5B8E06
MNGHVVSLIALVPMLLHSVWGCCWHHDHARSSRPSLVAASGAHCETDANIGFHDSDHEHPGQSDHPPGRPCHGGACVYRTAPLRHALHLDQMRPASLTCGGMLSIADLLGPQVVAETQGCVDQLPASSGERRALSQVWVV